MQIVLTQLSDKVRDFPLVKVDNGRTFFLMVSHRLGLEGAKCIAKALQWSQTNFQDALILAVKENDRTVAKITLSMDAKATTGLLNQAYREEKREVVKILVNAGVSLDHEDGQGNDFCMRTIQDNETELTLFLLTDALNRLDLNHRNKTKQSPLHLAVVQKQLNVVKVLLNQPKVDINQIDGEGNNALHHAARLGNKEMVNALMKQSLSIKDKNSDQKTVVQLAREKGHNELADWMEEKHRYKKVKPFLKPLQLKLGEQATEIESQKAEIKNLKSWIDKYSIFNERYSDKDKLSYVQQVENTSKAIEDKIDQTELSGLLKWVTEGHLVEVEKLLKKAPILLLGRGTVTDLSDRTFKGITALQYAAWSLDIEMCELMINYIGTHNASIQLKALSNQPEIYSPHGACYDMTPLITKTQMYFDNYDSWDVVKCRTYWQKEVGGEQRKCPAWLIYAWSEEGKDVSWTKKDASRKVTREYDKHRLVWWFTQNYNGGVGVGSKWCVWRGTGGRLMCADYGGVDFSSRQGARDDLSHLEGVKKYRHDAIQRIGTIIDTQLINHVTLGLS